MPNKTVLEANWASSPSDKYAEYANAVDPKYMENNQPIRGARKERREANAGIQKENK